MRSAATAGGHAVAKPHDVGIGRRAQRREHLGERVEVPVIRRQDADDGERLDFVRAIVDVRVERAADDRADRR